MPLHQILKLPAPILVPAYLALFLALDWLTFIPSFAPLGITPWNPSAGLVFGFLLLKGPRYLPLLPLCILLSDLVVRGLPLPIWGLLAEVAVTSCCYIPGLLYLWGASRPQFDLRLVSIHDVFRLAMVATASATVIAIAYVGVLVFAGYLPLAEAQQAAIRYWIGETIGIMVLTPFLLLQFSTEHRARPTLESVGQVAAVLLAVLVVFRFESGQQGQLYYVLFLPIVWIAVRSGLERVSLALVVMQVAIMTVLHAGEQTAVNVTEVQAMMLVLACAGLAIGILVRERGRAEQQVRLQQDAIARAARLGSIDRLTTSIAHEINQPLTAIGNYSRVTVRALDAAEPNVKLARDAAAKALSQVDRAAAVIHRLRNLIILGKAELAPVDASRLISEAVELMRPDLTAANTVISVEIARGLPRVLADQLQIQQLLTNVIRNGIEAMKETPQSLRRIRIVAGLARAGEVEIAVSDTGQGFPPGFRLVPDAPNPTSKENGLGIGLTLCHSIAEAHGGRLSISEGGQPATVSFTLKTAQGERHAEPQ